MLVRTVMVCALGFSTTLMPTMPVLSQDSSAAPATSDSRSTRARQTEVPATKRPRQRIAPSAAGGDVVFITTKALSVDTALDLSGAVICLDKAPKTLQKLTNYFQQNGMDFDTVFYATRDDARSGYEKGVCDVLTIAGADAANEVTKLASPADHLILPEIIK